MLEDSEAASQRRSGPVGDSGVDGGNIDMHGGGDLQWDDAAAKQVSHTPS